MKCRLCDRPTTPGTGKLCLDCTKALHRARAGSAAVRKQPASPPVLSEAMATMGAPLTLTPPSVLAPRWRRHRAWAAAGLIAIGIFYFAQSGPEPRHALDAVVVEGAPAASTGRSQIDLSVVSPSSEGPSSASHAIAAETPATTPEPQPKAETSGAKALPSSARTKTLSRNAMANANKDARASSPAYASANEVAAGKSPAPTEAESSQLLAQGSTQTNSPTDGAQMLASAMEKCGKETFLSRFVCEQKMYIQYCEDKWDKDPRCMRKTGNN